MKEARTRLFWPKPHSIRARMTLAFTLYIALLMGLMGLAFFLYLKHQEQRRVDLRLSQALGELREELESHPVTSPHILELVKEESEDLKALNVAVVIVDPRGMVVAHSHPSTTSWPLSPRWRTDTLRKDGYTFAVALPWDLMVSRLWERTRLILVLGTFVVFLSSLGAWFLVGRTLSPLHGLTRQASAASAESLQVQLATPSSDAEMVGLVATLNDLLYRLAATAQAQGRFYAAASHELRTPLHTLSVMHEVALSRPRSVPEYTDALTQSHVQTQRLTRLVQDLLMLNQLDMDTCSPEPVLVDLADICEGELNNLQGQVDLKSLNVSADLPATCEMTAPWTHITMLLRNLTENAVKYARCGGRVEVQVSAGKVRIWNECEFEANFEADKVFEAFYRPDASRNSQTGGNGLGLSICRAICQTNGWQIHFLPEDGGVGVEVNFR